VLDPVNGSTCFTAELAFGTRLKVVGATLEPVLRRVLGRRLVELQAHLHEEGVNLKRLLEKEPAV
jgi:hypothetical protein